MSDFYNPSSQHKCRVLRSCIYCAEPISIGAIYTKQTGVFEGSWFTNHYHPECFDDMIASCDGEFTPYSNERPVAQGEAA